MVKLPLALDKSKAEERFALSAFTLADEAGAEKAGIKAQETMAPLYVDLPPGFRDAMAFLCAGQEANAYIQGIKASRRNEPGEVAP